MYLAMSRVAHREGYPEIGLYWEKAALEEAEHAAKFAELLGEVVTDSTKKNLEMRVDAENGATAGKFELAKKAKELNLDAIHDTVHEMARDEAQQRIRRLAVPEVGGTQNSTRSWTVWETRWSSFSPPEMTTIRFTLLNCWKKSGLEGMPYWQTGPMVLGQFGNISQRTVPVM